jgi:hypothetical protein
MSAQRIQFLMTTAMIMIGIYLTGFETVHWFLYLPPIALGFAGITGICPALIVLKKLGLK